MKIKDYFYEEPDGIHYPDARAGTEAVYEVDFSRFVDAEGGALQRVQWKVSAMLTLRTYYMNQENPNVACALIGSPCVGSHKVTCIGEILKDGLVEVFPVELIIKVY